MKLPKNLKSYFSLIASLSLLSLLGLVGCDQGNQSSRSLPSGTYVAAEGQTGSSAYVKMASIQIEGESVGSYAIIHHQMPTLDFKAGLNTPLVMTGSGGATEGQLRSLSTATKLSGGSQSDQKIVSDIEFDLDRGDRVKYTVITRSAVGNKWENPILASTTGYLLKATPDQVIKLLKQETTRVQKASTAGAAPSKTFLAELGETLKVSTSSTKAETMKAKAPPILNENFCRKHFLNSCTALVNAGLLAASSTTQAARTSPDGQTEAPPRPAEQQRPEVSEGKPYPSIVAKNPVELQRAVQEATVRCHNEADCPASVGVLVGTHADSVYQCSTTHLGNGYFSTSSSCLPQALVSADKTVSKNCSGLLWVKMPQTQQFDAEVYECAEISNPQLAAGDPSATKSSDLVIFHVKQTVKREAAAAHWATASADASEVQLWPAEANPESTGLHSVIQRKTCRVAGPQAGPQVTSPQNGAANAKKSSNLAVLDLNSCSPQIVAGNVGATGFDASGKALLVVSSSSKLTGDTVVQASSYACSNFSVQGAKAEARNIQNCLSPGQQQASRVEQKVKSITDYGSTLKKIEELQSQHLASVTAAQNPVATESYTRLYTQAYPSPFTHFIIDPVVRHIGNFKPLVTTSKKPAGLQKLQFTPSDGAMVELEDGLGVQVNQVLLPACLKPLNVTNMRDYRSDWVFNPFSSPRYLPVKFLFPVGAIQRTVRQTMPKSFDASQIDQLVLGEPKTEIVKIKNVYEIELLDFYNIKTRHFNAPKIKVTRAPDLQNSEAVELNDADLEKRILETLTNLKTCIFQQTPGN